MARLFDKIGSSITNFFDKERYQFGRTFCTATDSGDIHWSTESKLSDDGKLESSVHFCHKWGDKDKFSVNTGTEDNPTFSLHTDRIKNISTSICVEDPKVKFGFKHLKDKFSVELKASYKWDTNVAESELRGVFEQSEKFTLGANVVIERAKDGQIKPKDFGVAAEFRRNDKQTLTLTTEESTKVINVGAEFGLPKDLTGVARVSYCRSEVGTEADDNQRPANDLGWGVGLKKPIDESSNLIGLFRHDGTATVMYGVKRGKWCTHLACNMDFKKPSAERHSLEYKLCFGH